MQHANTLPTAFLLVENVEYECELQNTTVGTGRFAQGFGPRWYWGKWLGSGVGAQGATCMDSSQHQMVGG
jgi:hypothetical protein